MIKAKKPNRTIKHHPNIEVVEVHQGEAEDEETRVSFLLGKIMFTLFSFSTSKLMNLNFPCFRYRHLQTWWICPISAVKWKWKTQQRKQHFNFNYSAFWSQDCPQWLKQCDRFNSVSFLQFCPLILFTPSPNNYKKNLYYFPPIRLQHYTHFKNCRIFFWNIFCFALL